MFTIPKTTSLIKHSDTHSDKCNDRVSTREALCAVNKPGKGARTRTTELKTNCQGIVPIG
jgi:hypothetical protein